MNAILTDELAAKVDAKIASGLYENANEVIGEALDFMDTHAEWVQQTKTEALRAELALGIQSLETDATPIRTEAVLDAWFEGIKKDNT